MSAKPTPGPLIVRVGANGDVGIIASSQATAGLDIGGALVAECFADIRRPIEGARAEALANATLFAASHEMLAALRELIDAEAAPGRATGGFVPKPATREHQQRVAAAWAKAHAVIAPFRSVPTGGG